MTDEEVIATFMEPRGLAEPFTGPEYNHPYTWWIWYMANGRHLTRELDLDALHEVEARLTGEQWRQYTQSFHNQFVAFQGTEIPYLRRYVHATAAQKIAALAAVLRPIVEAG